MTTSRRISRRGALVATTVAAPLVAIASLTAVALAQPPAERRVAEAFSFGEQAARELVKAKAWSGPVKAIELQRDATRRELVVLMTAVLRLPAGPIGTPWRDLGADDPQGAAAKAAVERGLLVPAGEAVALDAPLTGFDANRAWTLGLGMSKAVARMGQFRDGSGRAFTLPEGFGTSITAREAGLRRNYPSSDDQYERHDSRPLVLADLLLMASRGRYIRRNGVPSSVRALQGFTIPPIDPIVVPTVQRALMQVGNPYVWGGEWVDTNSPLDPQAAGGFDCSGLVWYVWHTGDRAAEAQINMPSGRTTYTMNVGKRGKRITWQAAQAGDLVFFGSGGRRTPLNQASHMSISLGNKWIIHSSGGRGGVSITYLPTYWPSGLMNARTFRVDATTPAAPDQPATAPPAATTPEPVTPAPITTPGTGTPQAPAPPAPPAPDPGAPQAPAPG